MNREMKEARRLLDKAEGAPAKMAELFPVCIPAIAAQCQADHVIRKYRFAFDQAALAGYLIGKAGSESTDKSADDGTNQEDRDMSSKKYTIATLGDILIVTAPDGSDDIRAIAEREVQSQHYSTNSVEIEYTSGLTLANALPEGAECIYSGIETGWLEDEDGINYRYAYHA